jgi:hypothetical protein
MANSPKTEERAKCILAAGGIRQNADGTYSVPSESSGKTYVVNGWSCTCPSRIQPCKHAVAVNMLKVGQPQGEHCQDAGQTDPPKWLPEPKPDSEVK